MQTSYQLLILTLRAGIDPPAKQRLGSTIRQATAEHWQDFLALSRHHNVSNLARQSLQNSGFWDSLPESTRQTLDARHRNTVAWSLKLKHSLDQVLAAFEKSALPVIPWKGPLLSQDLYGTIWSREYADLDFLVLAQHRSKVEALLNGLDFHQDENELLEYPPAIGNNNDHCQSYHHRQSGLMLEIHSQPFPSSFPFSRTNQELLGDCRGIDQRRPSLRRLSPEDEFLLLVAHGAKHHWCQLNWLYDFACFTLTLQDSLDWEKINQRATQLGCIRIIKTAFALAEKTLQLSLAPPQLDHPRTDATACRLADIFSAQLQSTADPQPPPNPVAWKYHSLTRSLLSRERYRDRLPVLSSALAYFFTPNHYDRRCCPGVFPLSLAAWVVRPFRLILKYGS